MWSRLALPYLRDSSSDTAAREDGNVDVKIASMFLGTYILLGLSGGCNSAAGKRFVLFRVVRFSCEYLELRSRVEIACQDYLLRLSVESNVLRSRVEITYLDCV